jgi:transcriptional regulator with PAS, ATPase and Fis domain
MVSIMKNNDVDKLLGYLTGLCNELSKGRYAKAKQLFELTKAGKYPKTVSELAETFGMMMVKIETREFHLEQLIDNLKKTKAELTLAKTRLAQENTNLKQTLRRSFSPSTIIGTSPKIMEVTHKIDKIAPSSANVLITGETGTGKELVAKTIHYASNRGDKPFIVLNCSAIPETIFESEIFGIEKGIATGVDKRIGKIEQANEGTIFLDEIGDMPLTSQTKILRVIEDRILDRVGGRKPIPVDIRIVAATNKDLKKAIKDGSFREDLFYRLNVVNLVIPPLRERRNDIVLLAKYFLDQYIKKFGLKPLTFTSEVLRALTSYPWPGNIRELKNEVERVVVLSTANTITIDELSDFIRDHGGNESLCNVQSTIKEGEKATIRKTLAAAQGNKSEAARLLGLSREGLRKKMIRFGIV